MMGHRCITWSLTSSTNIKRQIEKVCCFLNSPGSVAARKSLGRGEFYTDGPRTRRLARRTWCSEKFVDDEDWRPVTRRTAVDMTHDVVQIARALPLEDRVHEIAQLELDPQSAK